MSIDGRTIKQNRSKFKPEKNTAILMNENRINELFDLPVAELITAKSAPST